MQAEDFFTSIDVNDTMPVDQMLDLNQNGLNFRAVDSNYSTDIYFYPQQLIALDNVTSWMIDEALSEQMQIDYLFANGSVVGNESLFATSNTSFISIIFSCSSLSSFSRSASDIGSSQESYSTSRCYFGNLCTQLFWNFFSSKWVKICFSQKIQLLGYLFDRLYAMQ